MSDLIKTSHGSLWRLLSPRARLTSLAGYALALAGAWFGGQANVPGAHFLGSNLWDFALFFGLCLAIQDLFGTGSGCARAAFVLRMPRIVVQVQRQLLGLGLVLLLPPLALAWLAHGGMGMLAMAVTCLCAIGGFAVSQLVTDKRSSFLGMWVPLWVILAGVGPLERGEHPWGLTALALVTAAMLATMVGLWRYMLRSADWNGRAGPPGSAHGASRKLDDPWRVWNRGIDLMGGLLDRWWLSDLRATADLQRVGPKHPCRALRMAIGGFVMPQTPRAQAIQRWVFVATVMLPVGLVMFGITLLEYKQTNLALGMALVVLASLICSWLTLAHATRLRLLWSRPNAEMPLLALLPGLPCDDALRLALRKANTHTLWRFLGLELVACLLALWGGGGVLIGWPLGLLLGLFLGNAAAVAVLPMLVMNAQNAFRHAFVILSVALSLLVLISITALLFSPKLSAQVLYLLDLAWLLLVLSLGVIGWIGQRRWRRMPHPFLASAP